MKRSLGFVTVVLLGIACFGCQTPYGGGCAGGCCGGSCGVASQPAATYSHPVQQSYAPAQQQQQQQLPPPAFNGGSGTR